MSLVNVSVLDLGGDPLKNAQINATLKRVNPSKTIPQGTIGPSSDFNSSNYLASRAAGQITDKLGKVVLELQPNINYEVDSFYEFSVLHPFPLSPSDKPSRLWTVFAMVPAHNCNLELIATPVGLTSPTLEQIRDSGFVIEDPLFENLVGLSNATVGNLEKIAATSVYDSGADTTKSILKNAYGYIEAIADGVTKRAFGLSDAAGDLDISGILFGVELLDTGFYQPILSGSLVDSPVAYSDADVFRVEVDLDGEVKLYLNGTLAYSYATTAFTSGLRGVSSFATNGAKLSTIKIAGDELRLNSSL